MSDLLKSPWIPSAILNFFSNQPDFAALAGDISEEFQQRAQTCGKTAAKLWYWRESLRNAWALTAREVLRTPVRTILGALGCLLAVNLLGVLYFVIRYSPNPFQYSSVIEMTRHPAQRNVFLLLQFVLPLAAGWVGGRLLRGREWALALMFTAVSLCVALPGAWSMFVFFKAMAATPIREVILLGMGLRLTGFWLGCVWVRRSVPFCAATRKR